MKWRDKYNKNYLVISLYVIVTVMIIYSLMLLLKNAPAIYKVVMGKLGWLMDVIQPIIIGFVLAYLIDPVVNMLERRFGKLTTVKGFRWIKKPRTWAAFTSVFLVVIVFSGLISLLVYTVTDQLRLANLDDIVRLGNEYLVSVNEFYNAVLAKLNELDIQSQEFKEYVQEAGTVVLNALKGIGRGLFNSITNISGYMTTIIFSFIIGFYFIIDGRTFMSYLHKVCRALFKDNTHRKLVGMVHDLDYVFSGYIRGQLTDAFVMMILISLVLSITGVKFAIVIGIFAGICNLIPYFGPIVAYVSTTLVCLINWDLRKLVVSLIALLIIQAIDGNLIGPKLLSHSIKIHPLLVIVSLIFGSALGGFLGMLLAVPVGAYIKLVFVRFIERRLDKKEVKQKTANTNTLPK